MAARKALLFFANPPPTFVQASAAACADYKSVCISVAKTMRKLRQGILSQGRGSKEKGIDRQGETKGGGGTNTHLVGRCIGLQITKKAPTLCEKTHIVFAIKHRKQQSTSSAVVSGRALHVGMPKKTEVCKQYIGHRSGCVCVLVCMLWCVLFVLVSVCVCAFVVLCVTVAHASVRTPTWFHFH